MPLPAIADSLDAIPEAARGAYVEREGKFVLDAEIPDVGGLKSALQKERERADAAEKAAKAAAAAQRDLDLKQKGLLEAKQQWDAEILKPISEKLSALEQENRTLKLVTPLKDAFRAAGVIDPEDAWAVLGAKFDLSEAGKPILKDNPTADLAQWIATDLKAQKPHWFAGTQASGGGAPGGKAAPSRTIAANDPKQFLANLDGIAKGEVAVG